MINCFDDNNTYFLNITIDKTKMIYTTNPLILVNNQTLTAASHGITKFMD